MDARLRTLAEDLSRCEITPVHVVFHLPRCAGQTIHRHLLSHAREGSYFRVRKRKGASRVFLPKFRMAGIPDPDGLNVVSGHWVGDLIKLMFPGRPIGRSILLRDPVSHFVSHYNFRMMRYLSIGLQPYPIEIAYRARRRNFLTNFILRTFAETPRRKLEAMSAAEKYAEANEFLSGFFFVGDYTLCDELIAALAPDLGIPSIAEPANMREQWLERVNWRPLDVNDLPFGMMDAIRRDNMLDQLLWETWKDVGTNVAAARPLPHTLTEERLTKRLATQSSRFANQVRRRVYRRWSFRRIAS